MELPGRRRPRLRARGLANGTVENGVLHWSGERKPWWAAGLSSAAGVRGAWSRALGLSGARCALRALPPDSAPNATVVLPANARVPDFFAFRRGGPVFDGRQRVVAHAGARFSVSFTYQWVAGRVIGVAPPLAGAGPLRRARRYTKGAALRVAADVRAQTHGDGDRRVANITSRRRGLRHHPAAAGRPVRAPDSKPLAIEAIDRFAYHAAPAVACDAFQCAAKLARNALDALAEAAGPLQERDVLTACADCALRPVRFDDALRRVAQRAPNQQRKGLKGYFAARAPVQMPHREGACWTLRTPEPRARRRSGGGGRCCRRRSGRV